MNDIVMPKLDKGYRFLKKGDIIREDDEYRNVFNVWLPVIPGRAGYVGQTIGSEINNYLRRKTKLRIG